MSESVAGVRLLSVRAGAQEVVLAQPAAVPGSRRLMFSEGAWGLLTQLLPVVGLPVELGGLESSAEGSGAWDFISGALDGGGGVDRASAWGELRELGVAVPGPGAPAVVSAGVIHPSVVANLEVLRRPRVVVRFEAVVGAKRWVALVALAGALGAVVVRTADGFELSLFDPLRLGAELVRLVPQVGSGDSAAGGGPDPDLDVWDLGGSATGSEVLGWVPLAEVGERLSGEGYLCADVLGVEADPEKGVQGLLGRVVWLASGGGWVGLRAIADGTDRCPVEVVQVVAGDLPGWVAPVIAAVVDASEPVGPADDDSGSVGSGVGGSGVGGSGVGGSGGRTDG